MEKKNDPADAAESDPGAAPLEDTPGMDISEISREGYRNLKDGRLKEAEEAFQSILKREPENNYALVGMGDTLRKGRRCPQAVPYYQRCLESCPNNNYALFGLADCYKSQNQFSKAIEIWEEYLRLDPDNITVLTRIADAYRKVKNFDRSLELYQTVLEKEPGNPYALIGLGHLHYDFHHYQKALDFWKAMEAKGPKNTDIRVLTSIGNCYRKLKHFEQGIPYFEQALSRDGENFYALFGLADCYRGMGQPKRSLECWNRILTFDPTNKVILTRAGDALRNMGDYEQAESYYRRALDIDFDFYAILGLALIHKTQGEYEEAIAAMEGLKTMEPDNPRIYTEIADCLVRAGKKREALDLLGEFQARKGGHRMVADMLQRLQNGQGRPGTRRNYD